MQTPGLPAIGSLWVFGADVDIFAFCWPTTKVKPFWGVSGGQGGGEAPAFYLVNQTFSTKPLRRCQNTSVTDPLLEPIKIGGSFVKYTQEVIEDKNGNLILTSGHELIRGPGVEFDFNRPQVWIEQNVANLNFPLVASMIDTVNTFPLWGFAPRCIKLSDCTWERKIFGLCSYYFTRRFVFDIDFNTFDRYLLDEGTKVLRGYWQTNDAGTPGTTSDDTFTWIVDSTASPTNPSDYIRFKDVRGELAVCILNGAGSPALVSTGGIGTSTFGSPPGKIYVPYYSESDFSQLGIPLNFTS
jgi:hypothetical protein